MCETEINHLGLNLLIRLYRAFEFSSFLSGVTQRPHINTQGRAMSYYFFCNCIYLNSNHDNNRIRIIKEEIINFLSPSRLFSFCCRQVQRERGLIIVEQRQNIMSLSIPSNPLPTLRELGSDNEQGGGVFSISQLYKSQVSPNNSKCLYQVIF